MSMIHVSAKTRQLPVGQGGLMVSEIVADQDGHERRLAFAFDCGSLNREHLRQGIDAIDLEHLDILFVSHLDADHVNGIDLLLDRTKVDTVVLPCLDPLTLVAAVCSTLNDGGLTRDLLDFLTNPVAWLGRRGVDRVVFVTRDVDDGENGSSRSFEPNEPGSGNGGFNFQPVSRDKKTRLGWQLDGRTTRHAGARRGASSKVTSESTEATCALTIELGLAADPAKASWLLLPYVHPFPKERVDAFLAAVRKTLRVPESTALADRSFNRRMLTALESKAKRTELKHCYLLLSSDNNKPSMSLYSGPSRTTETFQTWAGVLAGQSHRWKSSSDVTDRNGWLTTGDADLSSGGTRDPWLKRYGKLLKHVAVFVLPHHGSNACIHDRVLARLGGAMPIACAAARRKFHPHKTLLARLELHDLPVCQVTERLESEFTLEQEFLA